MASSSRIGSTEPPILAFEDVTKFYGELRALDRVSFEVNRGEVVCPIGPSGSGKSTLLRCANALVSIDGGRILFDGTTTVGGSPSTLGWHGEDRAPEQPAVHPVRTI